ncbi:MAG: aminotransferase class I/II-fold pyridoxal phosphate-dependent enzyme [Cephaloticoccus sp.]|nr:aminotransferase class I/II-fold pyridoxal phosphate-dependent enzyme [Cephaloticoccus sp.]MCF7761734.1 aminotransferase class I/II-fold pyridoxal phosphate-dependent enzyme [Cephaloticoccus sp.]
MTKLSESEISRMHPETMALSYGFDPWLSEGAVKPPVFLTSTFAFKHAADGKRFFAWAHGEGSPPPRHEMGLIYSRINNPNLEIFEARVALWEKMQDAYSFSSGMAAIATTLLATHNPGDEMIVCAPVYGGTDALIHHFLKRNGITAHFVPAGFEAPDLVEPLINSRTRSIFIESPANPNNRLTDIGRMKELALRHAPIPAGQQSSRILVMVDNTMAGPVFAQPAKVGADIVLYSATKFIGGHSDVVGGVALANDPAILTAIAQHRAMLGGMPNAHTAWLLTRSLETLKIRAEAQQRNAVEVAAFLEQHPKVRKVCYIGLLKPEDPEYPIYCKQHTGPGSLISFYIQGGEQEAFAFLDHLKIFKLAVSLGSTESLAQHPAAMTHSGLTPEDKLLGGISDDLVRLSIGIENHEDLIWDLNQALAQV